MQDNFNLAKFVRQNQLLNENVGGYVDIKPLKEMSFDEMMGTAMEDEPEGDQYDGEYDAEYGPEITSELEKPEKIYADDSEGSYDNTDRMMDLGGNEIEKGIMFLLDDGFDPEDVLEMCKMFIDAHSQAAAKGLKF